MSSSSDNPKPCSTCVTRILSGGEVKCRLKLEATCPEYLKWAQSQLKLNSAELRELKLKVKNSMKAGTPDKEALKILIEHGDEESIKLGSLLGVG